MNIPLVSQRPTPKPMLRSKAPTVILSMTAALLLSACSSFSPDGGFNEVQQFADTQIGKQVKWQRDPSDQQQIAERVQALLSQPLGVEQAVQIAILNNQDLQASFYELGIAEADLVQAGRLPNPVFSFGRSRKDGEIEVDRGLSINFSQILLMPYTGRMERHRFERSKRELCQQLLRLSIDTRKAYYTTLAAKQSLQYMKQVKLAADASAELASRMAKAGNFSKLQQAREQGFFSEAAVNLALAQQAAFRSTEQFNRLLGLWGKDIHYSLPERLPDLPQQIADIQNIEQLAMERRLDVQSVRINTEQLASSLGLSKASRFINVLEFGVSQKSVTSQNQTRGYQVSFELPLFDWSGARVAKAEAIYMQSLHQAAAVAVNARSEAREAYLIYRSSYDLARHYWDELVPLKKRISEENLLMYNGMLIGVFDLLADARSQIASVNSAIEASRDFWIAQAELDMSLIGSEPGKPAPSPNH